MATQITVQQGIQRGVTYRFRYRALNKYGWSEYSDTSYILAAQVPSKPKIPVFKEATVTTIKIDLELNINNGGTPITLYELEINDGTLNGAFTPVTSYTQTSEFIIDKTAEGLTTGLIYKIRFRARNLIGPGEYSNTLYVALNDIPVTPLVPSRNEDSTTKTQIAVTW